MNFDVVIVGGGAAGMFAAVCLKTSCNGLRVAVLEQLPRVGKKLITTGNGRCNITNREITVERYHGKNRDFCLTALKCFDNSDAQRFFEKLGVFFVYDEVGRAYPYSLQAASVVDALRFAADELGVEVYTEQTVTDITKNAKGYTVKTQDSQFSARAVLVATGLYSGGEKLGCDGKLLRLLRDKFGFNVVKTTPAIVQIKTETDTVRSLKGIKVNATATLLHNGRALRKEYGEVLFCEYGLSGPPVLQLSREVDRVCTGLEISLDLMPEYGEKELTEILNRRIKNLYDRNLEEFFTGMLNKRVGQVLLKGCGFALSSKTAVLCGKADRLAAAVKNMRFTVKGSCGFINSQVTAGGLDTTAFSPETMMSKQHKGLFAAGEILDIDGDCGGFNLQWAWSSAYCAAKGIQKFLGVEK